MVTMTLYKCFRKRLLQRSHTIKAMNHLIPYKEFIFLNHNDQDTTHYIFLLMFEYKDVILVFLD